MNFLISDKAREEMEQGAVLARLMFALSEEKIARELM